MRTIRGPRRWLCLSSKRAHVVQIRCPTDWKKAFVGVWTLKDWTTRHRTWDVEEVEGEEESKRGCGTSMKAIEMKAGLLQTLLNEEWLIIFSWLLRWEELIKLYQMNRRWKCRPVFQWSGWRASTSKGNMSICRWSMTFARSLIVKLRIDSINVRRSTMSLLWFWERLENWIRKGQLLLGADEKLNCMPCHGRFILIKCGENETYFVFCFSLAKIVDIWEYVGIEFHGYISIHTFYPFWEPRGRTIRVGECTRKRCFWSLFCWWLMYLAKATLKIILYMNLRCSTLSSSKSDVSIVSPSVFALTESCISVGEMVLSFLPSLEFWLTWFFFIAWLLSSPFLPVSAVLGWDESWAFVFERSGFRACVGNHDGITMGTESGSTWGTCLAAKSSLLAGMEIGRDACWWAVEGAETADDSRGQVPTVETSGTAFDTCWGEVTCSRWVCWSMPIARESIGWLGVAYVTCSGLAVA